MSDAERTNVSITTGQYWLDATSFLHIAETALGPCISVCDEDMNVRYSALLSPTGDLLLGEVDELIRPQVMQHLPPDPSEATDETEQEDPKTNE
jgi:hypothetical protein